MGQDGWIQDEVVSSHLTFSGRFDFFGTANGVEVLAHAIKRETNPSDTLSAAASSAYAAFRATSGGRAFAAHAGELGAVVRDAGQSITTAVRTGEGLLRTPGITTLRL